MFQYGIQYWLAWVGSSLAFLFSAVVFVPFFHKLHLTSSFVVRNTMSAAYCKNVIYLDQQFLKLSIFGDRYNTELASILSMRTAY